jgi:hypothetical protein
MAESKRRSLIRETAGQLKEQFEANPFLDEMALVTRTKRIQRLVPGVTQTDTDTGLPKPVFYHGTRHIDTEQFTKFFKPMWDFLICMTRPGLLVLHYVCEQARPGNSIVNLERDEFVAQGHARHTYYNGLDELITFGLLARTAKRGYYWMNPACFFNGNRVAMTHEYIKPKKEDCPKPKVKPNQPPK